MFFETSASLNVFKLLKLFLKWSLKKRNKKLKIISCDSFFKSGKEYESVARQNETICKVFLSDVRILQSSLSNFDAGLV